MTVELVESVGGEPGPTVTTDVTDADGNFSLEPGTSTACEDDCYLKINGSAKGYQTGCRDCNAQVVATWPNACASPLGRIGRVFLDRL
jgi:hypothetical protein